MTWRHKNNCGQEYTEYRNSRDELHRDGDLPAIDYRDGEQRWYKNGKRHRDGDRPAIELVDGSQSWFINGKRHREGGLPAVVWVFDEVNHKMWYKNGELHREGGLPAIESIDGDHKGCWLNGRKLSPIEASAYTSFCQRMQEKKKIKAQKKLYFWWIQICYDLDHKSGCGQRMAQKNLSCFEELMTHQPLDAV